MSWLTWGNVDLYLTEICLVVIGLFSIVGIIIGIIRERKE